MFLPFVRKKLRDIFKKSSTIQRTFLCRLLSIGEGKMSPLSKKAGTSRSADIEIWRISKHSRCPDTRRFWEYPKPFITLLSTVWVEKACLGTYRWSAVPALWLQGLNLQLFRKRGEACTFHEAGASTTQYSKYDGQQKLQTFRYRDTRGWYVLSA